VRTAVGVNYVTELPYVEVKCGILEWLLHLTTTKPSQITASLSGTAVGVLGGQVGESGSAALDVALELHQLGNSIVAGSLTNNPPFGILP